MRNLFRPSYGGNCNCALMYTLGSLVVSSDDDMRPTRSWKTVPSRWRRMRSVADVHTKAVHNHIVHRLFDVIVAFKGVLGKRVAEIPENYDRGEVLVDSAMELETNATKGLVLEHSLSLQRGPVSETAIVKMAQTFRSGTNDIDAIDFVDMFLADEQQADPDAINDIYVLVNVRPVVTRSN